ncbi:hypothetical protein MMC09_002161 [Bachmanniomyces sp. S44760]|nr:hypothetical protein [Bachmanniomyces sp. S44760]
MAPVPPLDLSNSPDFSISSLELDRRSQSVANDLPHFLSTLTLSQREALNPPSPFSSAEKRSISPIEAGQLLRSRDAAPSTGTFVPGAGEIPPNAINNKGMLALFALLGVGMVLSSIWFFFWAKNGGFKFREGDWDDYKSTVLRRKGPNGTTLSNATKSTNLGGGSIVGEYDRDDDGAFNNEKTGRRGGKAKKGAADARGKQVPQKKNAGRHDDDVRAYRHEKPARVGGLNRQADGSYHDYTATEPSEFVYPQTPQKKTTKPANKAGANKKHPYGAANKNESISSMFSDDSHRPLRSSPAHNRHSAQSSPAQTPNRSRQHSPTKRQSHQAPPPAHPHSRTSMPGSYTEPLDFDSRYSASDNGTAESRGTKAYFHPIPGLSPEAKKGANGFRRGGGRRRDSLSDSEGETNFS